MARASKTALPSGKPLSCTVAPQGANAAGTSRHSNVDPGSVEASVNVADDEALSAGGVEVKVVSGGVRSTTSVHAAAAEVLPAGSVTVAERSWLLSGSGMTTASDQVPSPAATVG